MTSVMSTMPSEFTSPRVDLKTYGLVGISLIGTFSARVVFAVLVEITSVYFSSGDASVSGIKVIR